MEFAKNVAFNAKHVLVHLITVQNAQRRILIEIVMDFALINVKLDFMEMILL